jgi:hypothetical protein
MATRVTIYPATDEGFAAIAEHFKTGKVQVVKCLECGAPMKDGECSRYSTGAPDDMPCHPGIAEQSEGGDTR